MGEISVVRQTVELLENRFWARLRHEAQEAIRRMELPVANEHPLADLAPSAREQLARVLERLEVGYPGESEEILADLRVLVDGIKPYDFDLMLEGYVPSSQAGHLCIELEALLDPEGDITPTPGELRAAASVSCKALWEAWLARTRSEHTDVGRGGS